MATFAWSTIVWTIIPGLGQLRQRRRRLGWALLGAWSLFLFAAALTLPSGTSSWFVAAAVTVHAGSMILLFATDLSFERLAVRLAFGAMMFASLRYVMYGPLGVLLDHFVAGIELPTIASTAVIQTGDGLVYEGRWMRRRELRRGDLVVYDVAARSAPTYQVNDGIGLNRVIGVPGDRVEIREGTVFVNGTKPPGGQQPLWPAPMRGFNAVVPAGSYAIIPGMIDVYQHGNVALDAVFAQLVIVPDEQVRGRVLWRLQPWSRFGRVK